MTTWQDFFATQDLTHIRKWIAYTRSLGVAVYPSDADVFRAFDLTPLDQVRVVILGQDPYFNGEADGLAFSAGRAKRLPLSLQRIVAEVKDDGFEVASTWRGSLESWARQGVLLLNTALTVQHGTPGVYMQNWSRFTAALWVTHCGLWCGSGSRTSSSGVARRWMYSRVWQWVSRPRSCLVSSLGRITRNRGTLPPTPIAPTPPLAVQHRTR